ncbi:MAG TPA: glycosyltransferase family 39 protein [Myxococcota bacterium]|nr:glycosyltransferase family 39 protein [Myxococcota bacterium]
MAGVLRAQHWLREDVLFNDGPEFLRITKAMAAHDWGAALGDDYHPLYSLVTLGMQLVAPLPNDGYASAAALVSIVAGVASVLLLYLFARTAYGRAAAWPAALALAVHPYAVRFSGDVQSDGLYLALFLGAVLALWVALRDRAAALAGWAGALSGLAYLTRPEGAGVALIGGALGGLRLLGSGGSRARWVGWLAALGAACLVVMAPYLISIRVETGQWHLTKKKTLELVSLLDEEGGAAAPPGGPVSTPARSGSAPGQAASAPAPSAEVASPARSAVLLRFLSTLVSTLRPEFLVLLLFGIYTCWSRPGWRALFVCAFLGLYLAVLLGLAFHGYVSRRHVLPPLVLTFGYVAVGLPVLGEILVSIGGSVLRAQATPRPRLALGIALLCLLVPSLAKELRPHDHAGLAERRAAEWLRAEQLAPGPVAASKDRVAYYADAPFVPLRHAPDAGLVADLKDRGARYLIVEEDGGEGSRAARRAQEGGLPLLHRLEAGGREAWVYALPAP